jgi:hypothetical protein
MFHGNKKLQVINKNGQCPRRRIDDRINDNQNRIKNGTQKSNCRFKSRIRQQIQYDTKFTKMQSFINEKKARIDELTTNLTTQHQSYARITKDWSTATKKSQAHKSQLIVVNAAINGKISREKRKCSSLRFTKFTKAEH